MSGTTARLLAKALEALVTKAFNRCLFPDEVRAAFVALDAYYGDHPDAAPEEIVRLREARATADRLLRVASSPSTEIENHGQ
jgi:hypothetical protein